MSGLEGVSLPPAEDDFELPEAPVGPESPDPDLAAAEQVMPGNGC